jgi:two-component system chemotaxis response regulator CheB
MRAVRLTEGSRQQPEAAGRDPTAPWAGQCRVMVVDDSSVVRGFIVRMLESDARVCVVASVDNGRKAVERLRLRRDIDVIVLDIEMPVMDGLTALGELLDVDPAVQVVMASTLTQHNAEISLRALEKGAADYIPKPTARNSAAMTISAVNCWRR